jgi:hypothetical protein
VENFSPIFGTMAAEKWLKRSFKEAKKGIHDARKIAEATEKGEEPEGQIGIN